MIREWSIANDSAPENFQPIGSYGPQLWLELPHASTAPRVTYARTSIYSDSPRTVVLRFGSDSAMQLSINGAEVFHDDTQGAAAFDQHVPLFSR